MATPSEGGFKAKIVLLGEGAVGKTSIVTRYVENRFNDKHVQTLQAAFLQKNLNIAGHRIVLNIWDTAGQERFHALGPIYYRDSHAALVVYDITDEDSFIKARNWIKELRKMLGENIVVAIVGNKMDLEKNRKVTQAQAEEYATSVGAKHYYASAKQNKGIQELFLDISKRLIESQVSAPAHSSQTPAASAAAPSSGVSKRASKAIVVEDETPNVAPKGGCC